MNTMEFEYINLVVIFLLLLVTLNLLLTAQLMKAMRNLVTLDALKMPLAIGTKIERFVAVNKYANMQVDVFDKRSAKVFVFLLTGCPSCKERIKDVTQAIALSENEGVDIYLLTKESYNRCRAFLKGTDLLSHLLHVDKHVYAMLNPQSASPAYLFVNDSNIVEAEGLIGDQNWMGFIQQLTLLEDDTTGAERNTHTA